MNTTPLAPDNAAWQARISAGLEETHSTEQSAGDQAMSIVNIAKIKYIPDFERSIQAGRNESGAVALRLGMEYLERALQALEAKPAPSTLAAVERATI